MFKVGDIIVSDPKHLSTNYKLRVTEVFEEDEKFSGLVLEGDGRSWRPGESMKEVSQLFFKKLHDAKDLIEDFEASLNKLEQKLS